ncbi:MAG: hypothetical protein AAF933_14695 [Pseudomonadota bacterium]
MMSGVSKRFWLGLAAVLMACEAAGEGSAPLSGGVAFQFAAKANTDGNCQPERQGLAHVGSTDLFAVRGEATYSMPGGDTKIPFQGVFNYPDDNGFASDTAVVSLNYPGSCADLAVKIRIDYCEFDVAQGREKRSCPEITVNGSDGFSSIELIRSDLENGEG